MNTVILPEPVKCKISWIDKQGEPTPDSCQAEYMATCHFAHDGNKRSFPCCAHHYQRGIGYSNWTFEKILTLPQLWEGDQN